MVMKERLPPLRRWSSSFDHILGYARRSDVDAELEQLSVDPRRSPQRIGNAHLADKLAYLQRHSWSAATAPRLQTPKRSEPDAVPFHDGLRFQNCQSVQDCWRQSIQPGKDQAVHGTEGLPLGQIPALCVDLMLQHYDLSYQHIVEIAALSASDKRTTRSPG